jgi:hypothetical protein
MLMWQQSRNIKVSDISVVFADLQESSVAMYLKLSILNILTIRSLVAID